MGAYSLAEAEQQLERLVYEALAGEIVTIIRDGRPVVTLTPSAQTAACAPIDDEYREWCANAVRLARAWAGTL